MLSRLSRRERNMVMLSLLVIVLFIVVQFIFFPAIDRRQALVNQLHAKKDTLEQMSELGTRYSEIQASMMTQRKMVMKRDKSFTLFSFIDRLAQESNIKDNVAYIKPSTRKSESTNLLFSNVKVRIDSIAMQQAVDFIYKIESSDSMVHIRSLSFSKSGDENKLSAIIETETIVAAEG
ncbi:MAG: type II secretion system protein M [Desulfamplus sp.]|nr:type II secretion system protein M [Desulfamplus sp.]